MALSASSCKCYTYRSLPLSSIEARVIDLGVGTRDATVYRRSLRRFTDVMSRSIWLRRPRAEKETSKASERW